MKLTGGCLPSDLPPFYNKGSEGHGIYPQGFPRQGFMSVEILRPERGPGRQIPDLHLPINVLRYKYYNAIKIFTKTL